MPKTSKASTKSKRLHKASNFAPTPSLSASEIVVCRASQRPSKILKKAQTQSGRESSVRDMAVLHGLEAMTAKNWQSIRDELLAIIRNQ